MTGNDIGVAIAFARLNDLRLNVLTCRIGGLSVVQARGIVAQLRKPEAWRDSYVSLFGLAAR